jgi:hypothetical protein
LPAEAERSDVAGFMPSRCGLHFPNSFPQGTPAVQGIPASINIPGDGSLAINDAANGLCGGMALTVIDYLAAGIDPPADTSPPEPGSALYRHLVRRLLDSWNLPTGPMRYLHLMNPLLPDHETWLEPWGHGRSWIVIRQEWPKVRADIDGGRLSPLGLIKVKSWNPMDLARNHQVTAYGYEFEGTRLTLHLYDPNQPDDDGVTMSLDVADPSRATPVTYSPPDPAFPEVFCFFRVDHQPVPPPST